MTLHYGRILTSVPFLEVSQNTNNRLIMQRFEVYLVTMMFWGNLYSCKMSLQLSQTSAADLGALSEVLLVSL